MTHVRLSLGVSSFCKRSVHAVLVTAGLLASSASSPAALVGYWKFDEGSGTTAADTSGSPNNHNGTLAVGGTGALPTWIAGRFGGALDFNRVSDLNGSRVTVPNHAELRLNDSFTISFWYRPGPNIGTFPGPMRFGTSQSDASGNIGWGFYRAQNGNRVTYKRGNAQPNLFPPTLVNGQWYHIILRNDGASGNLAIVSDVSTNTTAQAWLDCNATAIFEFGRMDQFDDCDIDDVALFDEALPAERMATIHSVPTRLGVDYNLADVRALWAIFDGGPGSSGTVKGSTWTHTTTLPGSTVPGSAYLSGSKWYVVLSPTAGLVANALLLGDISPAGVGLPGTTIYSETPSIATTARFVFDLGGTTTIGGNVNDLIELNGDLNLANQTVVINPLVPLATGTYRLMNYTGARTGSFNATVLHRSRYTMTLDQSTPGEINLTVAGVSADSKWNSTSNGSWDFTTQNWLSGGSPSAFFQADSVTFDDSATFQTNINVTADVFPSSITINSSLLNYSLSGVGRIGGAGNGITKSGTGLLTLGSANLFVGQMNVNGGTLRLGNAAALGSTLGGTVVGNGATLDLGGAAPGGEAVRVQGAGVGGLGAVFNSGAAIVNNGLTGGVTLEGDTTFGGVNRWDVFGGTFLGNGFKLTKVGAPEIALSNLRDTGLGEIDVRAGILTILGSTTLGDPTKTLFVRTNAVLAFWATGTNQLNKPLVLESAQIRNASPAPDVSTNLGLVSLTGNNTANVVSGIRLQGVVSGSGGLTKIGAGTLALDANNTYTGNTVISAGRLTLGAAGGIATSPSISVASGAVLDVSAVSGFALADGQTLSGSGAVHGSVTAGNGTTLVPGTSAGTLTVTNGLSLNGGATLIYELSGATTEGGGVNDLISVGGALDLSGGVTTVKVLPIGPISIVAPYTLISYAGSLSGSPLNLNVTSDSRLTFATDTVTTPGKVQLLAAGAAELVEWSGGDPSAPNAWDLKTTANWASTIVPDIFYAGDTAVFNDLGVEFNVTLVGDLFPAHTRVEADANDYTFSGAGRIRGGGLTKDLGGKLTLANTGINDYPGSTVISGGALQLGVGGTAGNVGPAPIVNNARLILNRSDDLAFPNTMTGTGTFEKQGNNVLTLPAALSGFDGTIVINGGIARPTVTNGVGSPVGGTVVANGGTLDLNGLNISLEPLTISGAGVGGNGAIVNGGAGQNNALRFVTLGGDATVGGANRWDIRNPGAGASLTGNGFALTKVGANQFSLVGLGDTGLGDINVQQGLLSVEGNTALGLATGTVNVQSGATLMFWGSTVPHDKRFALNGGARLFKDNGTVTIAGPVSLTGSNALDAASNSGTDMVVSGVIGGSGLLNKIGAGNVILTANNDYSGGTLVSAGNLFLGNGGTAGSVAGNITANAGLFIHRSDSFTLANNVSGSGNMFLRTAGGLILDGTAQVNLAGSLEVGRDQVGRLTIRDGANPVIGRLHLGNIASTPGEVIQEGGNVIVSLELRVGHWPTETSTYIMGGGSISLTNVPTGTATERNGIFYVGVDGHGIYTQTGGVVTAHGLVLDSRGDSPGVDTFNLDAGVFNVGPSGIGTGNATNSTYQVNLGGGVLAATASWTSPLRMSFSGVNGDAIIDTGNNTNRLNGNLSGIAGFIKRGGGLLTLAGTNNYEGYTLVSEGTLSVIGESGIAFGEVRVASGARLMGNGIINDAVVIEAGGTLAPGLSIGTLRVNADLTLAGSTVMEINKTGATLTSDRVTGIATLNAGGSLTVLATGDALAAGDSFQLFSAGATTGSFSSFVLPTLTGALTWDLSQLATAGVIQVAAANPQLSVVFTGTALEISWPDGYTGFQLQAQTNAPGVGITPNWFDVLGLTTNHVSFPIVPDPSIGSIFYRLIKP